MLGVPGAPNAYYYKPRGKESRVLMYLHGRGGNPARDCAKWANVGTRFGWVVCPSGAGQAEDGRRVWGSPGEAKIVIDRTLRALREKYPRKVNQRQNILVGFSEGAYIAMNVGAQDPATWPRWLILGGSDRYWSTTDDVFDSGRRPSRVYLLTGEDDGVARRTLKVASTLRKARVAVRTKIVPGLGHEVPADQMITTYYGPLLWLIAK